MQHLSDVSLFTWVDSSANKRIRQQRLGTPLSQITFSRWSRLITAQHVNLVTLSCPLSSSLQIPTAGVSYVRPFAWLSQSRIYAWGSRSLWLHDQVLLPPSQCLKLSWENKILEGFWWWMWKCGRVVPWLVLGLGYQVGDAPSAHWILYKSPWPWHRAHRVQVQWGESARPFPQLGANATCTSMSKMSPGERCYIQLFEPFHLLPL